MAPDPPAVESSPVSSPESPPPASWSSSSSSRTRKPKSLTNLNRIGIAVAFGGLLLLYLQSASRITHFYSALLLSSSFPKDESRAPTGEGDLSQVDTGTVKNHLQRIQTINTNSNNEEGKDDRHNLNPHHHNTPRSPNKNGVKEAARSDSSSRAIETPTRSKPTTPTTPHPTSSPTDKAYELNKRLAEHEWARMREQKLTDYADSEFPYPLTCEPDSEKLGKIRAPILMAYHVGMMNNWKAVVADQLNTLSKCGWEKLNITRFILSYSGKNSEFSGQNTTKFDALREVFEPYAPLFDMKNATFNDQMNQTTNATSPSPRTILLESTSVPWEGPVLNQLRDTCQQFPDGIALYFHDKGVSKYTPDWREKLIDVWTYSRSLYWRKFMEYFLLERPNLCLERLLATPKNSLRNQKRAKACGILYRKSTHWSRRRHFSGNFFMARCDYLSTLSHVTSSGYTDAEFWIGRKASDLPSEFISLAEADLQLYQHLILPREYSNYTKYWDSHQP